METYGLCTVNHVEGMERDMKDDTVSRQAAIDAHCELCEDKGFCGDICPDVEVFRLIPSAIGRVVAIVVDEYEEALREAVERCMI